MFENLTNLETNLEGTYVKPIVIEENMTTIDQIRQSVREKNPGVNEAILERLELVDVKYLSKDNKVYTGQIVVDKELVNNILSLFKFIEEMNNSATKDSEKFFIEKIVPIQDKHYEGDDEKSMGENNTSGFNYRFIKGTLILSLHSFAFAIDINPRDNPLVQTGEKNQPANGKYDAKKPNTLTGFKNTEEYRKNLGNLTPGQKVVQFLTNMGFEWGGDWESSKGYQDYQHFEKVIPTKEYIENYLNNVITNPSITKEDVVKRIERLIYNNIANKYTDNLIHLLASQKVIDMIGEVEHEKFSQFLNEQMGNKF